MLAGDVLTLTEDGRVDRLHVGPVAAAVRPRAGGGMAVATERGFALFAPDGDRPEWTTEVWTDPAVRMNDGGCDPQGRFYCGSVRYDGAAGGGALHRLDPDHTVTTVLDRVTVSNGLAWTANGREAYYVDSGLRSIEVLTFSPPGQVIGRRVLVSFQESDGVPDGLCVDAEDHVWIAMYGTGVVHRYAPSGGRTDTVHVPVSAPTACTLGGPGAHWLFITTSRLQQDGHPLSGAVFAVHVDVPGVDVMPFAG
jgi:sugar lactone lactonase YvrE